MSPDRANHCFTSDVAYGIFMYQAVVLFACDIIIFLLPFPALIKLHMGSAKKTALLLVFGSGLIACIAPAIRFKSIQFYKSGSSDTTCKLKAILSLLELNHLLKSFSVDAGASSLYWMAIEYNLGLVAGSLTGIRPLISRIGVLVTTRGDSDYKSNNQFSPSYRLDNHDNRHWDSSQRSGVKGNKFQGDSVLELTVFGDRSSEDIGHQQILKTQSFTITEEARNSSSFANTQQPWQDCDRKV